MTGCKRQVLFHKKRLKYALNIHTGQKVNLSNLAEENWQFHRILLTIWWQMR